MSSLHVQSPAAAEAPVHLLQGIVSDPKGADLMTRIAARDERAFESFYRSSIGLVFGLALRITRKRESAEEVAEDVYVQIWNRAASFDAMRGTPLAWALTICRSRAIDSLRRVDQAVSDPEPTERVDASIESGADLQDLLLASRRNAALHAAIDRLRPIQRQLLSLAFFRGLTHPELAAHTGLPLGTVKSTMRRTLVALREELGCSS
jgi:RNA polymerase sigma-70 factor (ECF subfamily)